MRFLSLLPAVFVLLLPGHSIAQGFLEYVSEADRFGVSFSAEPEVRDIAYTSEYEVQFPARLYTVHDGQSFYSVTVVDFRDAQSIYTEMLKDKSPTEINTFRNRWIGDQRASVARAARQFRQRGGEITYDAWGHVENVEGHQLHMVNNEGETMNAMTRLVFFLALSSGTAIAQDARTVLEAAATALGTHDLHTVQYSATGRASFFGQSHGPNSDWPQTRLDSYTRTIDYDAMTTREDFVQTQGNYPRRGGGMGFPIQDERRESLIFNGEYAWAVQGDNSVPQPGAVEQRLLSIVMTPHGFLKAAMASSDATATRRYVREQDAPTGGCCREVTVVTFTAFGKFRINGTINERNEVENIQTWLPNPVLGDMLYEVMYREGYEDFSGIKFPREIDRHFGNNRVNPGHNMLDIEVNDAKPNLSVTASAVPDNVRAATVSAARVESREIANGVWFLGGGSHNSVAVEFDEFVTVIEAPLNEARSLAVIAEVNRLIPDKPIQYLVNSHHHFDHLGGIRTYAALGSVIVTHGVNRDYYSEIVFSSAPRTLEPDLFSRAPRYGSWRPYIVAVGWERNNEGGKYVIGDRTKSLEVHAVLDLDHAQDMLMVYLPAEKIVVNADLWSPGRPAPATISPNAVALYENIGNLNLDVERIVGLHGNVGPLSDLVQAVGANAN